MDEITATLRAREFVNRVNPSTHPAPVDMYLAEVKAVLREEDNLGPDESGYSFEHNGKYYICVNANDRLDRQRFTICHEIAHKILGLSSAHEALPSWSYAKRPLNEILCDVFAAELLLPYRVFQPLAEKAEIGFAAVDALAKDFEASRMATGSRFATVLRKPCAFVLSEQGKVRHASRSASLREAGAWISPGLVLPNSSASARIRNGDIASDGAEKTEADIWFSSWDRGGVLLEEVRHYQPWDQTLTLLWFEDEEVPPPPLRYQTDEAEDEPALKELDGVLPWPGRSRRRS